MRVRSLGGEDPLEKGTATHSSILSWRIPWTEEPEGLQSMGSQSWTPLKPLSSGSRGSGAPQHVGSSPIRDQTRISCISRQIFFFTIEPPGKPLSTSFTYSLLLKHHASDNWKILL